MDRLSIGRALWNGLLDEVMAPTMFALLHKKSWVNLPNSVAECDGVLPNSRENTAGCLNHLAFTDDVRLTAKSEQELASMYRDRVSAIAVKHQL